MQTTRKTYKGIFGRYTNEDMRKAYLRFKKSDPKSFFCRAVVACRKLGGLLPQDFTIEDWVQVALVVKFGWYVQQQLDAEEAAKEGVR